MHGKGTTVPAVCRHCGSDFFAAARAIRKGYGIYCTRRCAVAHRSAFRPVPIDRGDGTYGIPLMGRDKTIRDHAIVDAADLTFVMRWRWYLLRGYVQRNEGHTTVKLHRALLGLTVGDRLEGDHINRNHLDHRRSNLRALDRDGNAQNRSSYRNSSSIYRGVSWDDRLKQWKVQVQIRGKKIHIGCFNSEAKANNAAKAARARLMPNAVD